MTLFFFFTFLLMTCGLLLWGLTRPNRIYELPFLAGAVLLGWVMPQAVGLLGDPRLPEGALARTLAMATLCALALYAGYRIRPRPLPWADWRFSKRRLLYAAAGLSVLGAYFQWKIRALPDEMLVGRWQGLPVAYLFFAKVQIYGLALAAVLFTRTRSRWALAIVLFDLAFWAQLLLIGARRGLIVEFGLIALLAAWFGWRRSLPRPAMIAALAVGTLFVFSVGQYRATVYGGAAYQGSYGSRTWHIPTVQEVLSIDYLGTFQQVLNEGAGELRNAAYDITATRETLAFDYGRGYWNELVQDFIPRQLVGEKFKESLKFPLPELAYQVYGHVPHTGTTHTGFADSFGAFGYLGALVFFAIAWLMRSLYGAALRGGLAAQLAYMLLITDALHAITHGTSWFLTNLIHLAVFGVPVLMYARWRPRRAAAHPPIPPDVPAVRA